MTEQMEQMMDCHPRRAASMAAYRIESPALDGNRRVIDGVDA
jgi:hypothetical protein